MYVKYGIFIFYKKYINANIILCIVNINIRNFVSFIINSIF